MRKIIFILIVCLLIQLPAFAYTDVFNEKFENKLEALSEYNIINGYEDGTFRPQNPITRAEFCKLIICATMNEGIELDGNGFSDVSDSFWAKDYICAARALEIVNGVTATAFAPQANITNEQAIKMIVCSLGYGEEAIASGGYPNGYIKIAKDLGIIENNFNAKAISTRQGIAEMVYNALDIELYLIYVSGDGSIERQKSLKTLREIYENYESPIEASTDEESEVIVDESKETIEETEVIIDESESITEEASNDDEVLLSESELETVG